MRSERFRLKSRWKNGETECPPHIKPDQWSKLMIYWDKKSTKEKTETMANARQEVKAHAFVGRRSKDGKEAKVVHMNLFM